MIGFSEAQLLQWIVPLLWPLLRILGLFAAAPVLSMRVIPVRARIGLALLTALCAQPVLPPMPVLPLDTPTALAMVVQQVFIGVTIGFAAKVVFTAIEFAGEVIGLQMGLNFATFFDPTTSGQSTVSARLFNTRDKNYQSAVKMLLDLLPVQEKADAANEIMRFAFSGKR